MAADFDKNVLWPCPCSTHCEVVVSPDVCLVFHNIGCLIIEPQPFIIYDVWRNLVIDTYIKQEVPASYLMSNVVHTSRSMVDGLSSRKSRVPVCKYPRLVGWDRNWCSINFPSNVITSKKKMSPQLLWQHCKMQSDASSLPMEVSMFINIVSPICRRCITG